MRWQKHCATEACSDALGTPDGAGAEIAVVVIANSVLGIVVAIVAIKARLRHRRGQSEIHQIENPIPLSLYTTNKKRNTHVIISSERSFE